MVRSLLRRRRSLLPAVAALMLAAAFPAPGRAQENSAPSAPGGPASANALASAPRAYNGHVTGNLKSKVYRYPWDRRQPPVALRIVFPTVAEAEAAGYHLAPNSAPVKKNWRLPGQDADGFGPEVNFLPRRSEAAPGNHAPGNNTPWINGVPPWSNARRNGPYTGPVVGYTLNKMIYFPWMSFPPWGRQAVKFPSLDAALKAGYHVAHGVFNGYPSAPDGYAAGNISQGGRGSGQAPRAAAGRRFVPGHGNYSGPVLGNHLTRQFICPGDDPSIGGPYNVRFESVGAAYRAGYEPVSPLLRYPPKAPSRF